MSIHGFLTSGRAPHLCFVEQFLQQPAALHCEKKTKRKLTFTEQEQQIANGTQLQLLVERYITDGGKNVAISALSA